MKRIILFLVLTFFSSVCSAQNPAQVPRGRILNDIEPWFIKMDNGERYGCLLLKGSELFSEGETVALVILPKRMSFMMSIESGRSAQVYCVGFGKFRKKLINRR